MWSNDNQGRNEDVEAPDINWTLVCFLGCVAVAVVVLIGGLVFLSPVDFIAGIIFGGVCVSILAIFAIQSIVAPRRA